MTIAGHLAELDPEGKYAPSEAEIELIQSLTPVSRETIARLTIYHALLHRWQSKTNLVAQASLAGYWERHVADSLQVLPIACGTSGSIPSHWVDIGSGGGFPGMVLAIVLAEKAELEDRASLVMVESIQKKCAFLRRVLAETEISDAGLSATVACIRIESAAEHFQSADIITARALASLNKLLELTGKYLGSTCEVKKRALFHKGRDHQREIEESRGIWDFDLIVHPSRINPESVILEISNVSRLSGES